MADTPDAVILEDPEGRILRLHCMQLYAVTRGVVRLIPSDYCLVVVRAWLSSLPSV